MASRRKPQDSGAPQRGGDSGTGPGGPGDGLSRDELEKAAITGFRGEHPDFGALRSVMLDQHANAVGSFEQEVKQVPKHQRTTAQHDVANSSQVRLPVFMGSPMAACEEVFRVARDEVGEARARNARDRRENPDIKELKASAVRTRNNEFVVTDIRYENYSEFSTPQGPRCTLPISGRLTMKFGKLSNEAQGAINAERVDLNLTALGPRDSVAMEFRCALSNPRRMRTSYQRDASGARAQEVVQGDFEMDGVSDAEAMEFAARKLEGGEVQRATAYRIVANRAGAEFAKQDYRAASQHENVPTLIEVLEDRQNKGGKFTAEEQALALAETKGRLVAERGNLAFGSKLNCAWGNIASTLARATGKPSVQDPETPREVKGTVPVTREGELTGRRDALTPDVGIMPGAGIARVYTPKCTDQRFMQAKVLEAERAQEQALERERRAGQSRGM